MAQQTADGHNLLRWAKRGLQQPIGMQSLQPLAVQHVRLAPGYILQMPRIHQKDADTALFQDLVQGDPVDPGRLHRHRIHPTGFQPVGQPLQILGKNPKTAYTLFVAVWRHGYIDLLPTDINPGGIGVDLIQRIHHDLSLLHSRFSHVILQMKLNWSRPDQNVQVEYAPKRGPRRATNEKTSMIGTKLVSGSNDTSGGTVLTVWTYCLLYPLLPSFFWKEGRCRPGITRNDSSFVQIVCPTSLRSVYVSAFFRFANSNLKGRETRRLLIQTGYFTHLHPAIWGNSPMKKGVVFFGRTAYAQKKPHSPND